MSRNFSTVDQKSDGNQHRRESQVYRAFRFQSQTPVSKQESGRMKSVVRKKIEIEAAFAAFQNQEKLQLSLMAIVEVNINKRPKNSRPRKQK